MDTIVPSNDIPRKQCQGECQQILPDTEEYFHRSNGRLHPICKQCVKTPPDSILNVPEGYKRCSNVSCHGIYPATPEFFHRNKAMKDGLDNHCKKCKSERGKEYSMRQEVRDKRLIRQKEWNDSHKEYHHAYYQAWRQVETNREAEKHQAQRRYQEKREYIRQQGKIYYQNNRESILARHKSNHEANKERRHEQQRQYRSKNRERIRASGRRYAQTERGKEVAKAAQTRYNQTEKSKITRQAYYQRNREHIAERARLYQRTEQGKVVRKAIARRYHQTEHGKLMNRIQSHNHYARKKAVAGTHTAAQIAEQLKRQKYKCYYAACGFAKFKRVKENGQWKYLYEIDHTFPLSRVVGTDIPANDMGYLVLACKACNDSKNNRYPHEWPQGGRLL